MGRNVSTTTSNKVIFGNEDPSKQVFSNAQLVKVLGAMVLMAILLFAGVFYQYGVTETLQGKLSQDQVRLQTDHTELAQLQAELKIAKSKAESQQKEIDDAKDELEQAKTLLTVSKKNLVLLSVMPSETEAARRLNAGNVQKSFSPAAKDVHALAEEFQFTVRKVA